MIFLLTLIDSGWSSGHVFSKQLGVTMKWCLIAQESCSCSLGIETYIALKY